MLVAAGCAAYVAPVAAQVDLSGHWLALYSQDWQLRIPGPDPVDFTGLPINAAARAVALSYDAEQLSRPESQCSLYAPTYVLTGPGVFTMWADFDPKTGSVIAWNTGPSNEDQPGFKIWMDDRPQPSKYADNDFRGFTTGRWVGTVLVTYTTHMKRWLLRRNGVPLSDQATLTQHWIRHGNLLTIVGEIDDPVYLTEPYIYTRVLIQDPSVNLNVFFGGTTCEPSVEVAAYANEDTVPNYLPGLNPTLRFDLKYHGIPPFAALGGADEMYPEYQKRLIEHYTAPAKCVQYCCGGGGSNVSVLIKGCPTFGPGRELPMPAPITP